MKLDLRKNLTHKGVIILEHQRGETIVTRVIKKSQTCFGVIFRREAESRDKM